LGPDPIILKVKQEDRISESDEMFIKNFMSNIEIPDSAIPGIYFSIKINSNFN